MTGYELEQRNIGATITARKLLDIARTGEHSGKFGCPIIQACAEEIVKLYQRANEKGEKQ